jgi:ABC-type nickel/cobalt efflux system permease component RcnA
MIVKRAARVENPNAAASSSLSFGLRPPSCLSLSHTHTHKHTHTHTHTHARVPTHTHKDRERGGTRLAIVTTGR